MGVMGAKGCEGHIGSYILCAKYVFHCVIVHFISLFFCRDTKDTGDQRTSDAMNKKHQVFFGFLYYY